MKAKYRYIIPKFAEAELPLALAQTEMKSDYAVKQRAMTAAILHQVEHLSQYAIADILHRDQSSISRILRLHENLLLTDKNYKNTFEKLKQNYIEKNAQRSE